MSIAQRSRLPRGSSVVVIALLVGWLPSASAPARGDSSQADSRTLMRGVWGGDHIRMVISRDGAQLEFDCATGTIDRPIVLDAAGAFTAKGSYTPEHGGPRRDDQAAAPGARYAGRVSAQTMTLTV